MKTCRLCKKERFLDVVNFGPLPVGYPIDPSQGDKRGIWAKNLELVMCSNCHLIRTVYEVPKKEYEYHIIRSAGLQKLLNEEDKQFANDIATLLSLPKDALIADIGCGDGGASRALKALGYKRLIGIDPVLGAKRYPFKAIQAYLDDKVVNRLRKEKKQPDCVILKHVIHLLPNLNPFLARLSRLVKEESYVVFEVPYIVDIFKNKRVDATGHLRCNWFGVSSFDFAFQKYGFSIYHIAHNPSFRGGTLRVVVKKGSFKKKEAKFLQEIKRKEKKKLTRKSFESFRNDISKLKKTIRSQIAEMIRKRIPIYGYGGGFKASILASWLGLTSADIKMVVDQDPEKQWKILPLSNIPVRPVSELLAVKEKVAVINFALDYQKDVNEFLLKNLKKDSLIIIFFPEFRLITV